MIFNFEPGSVTAGFPVFKKAEYRFEIKDVKPFIRRAGEGTEAEHDSYGLRFSLVGKSGEALEKKSMYTAYMHSDGAQSFSKQFLMAVFGYGKGSEEEERFNRDYADADFRFDPAAGTMSDLYRQTIGKNFYASVDVKPNPQSGDEQQQWKSFRPFVASRETANV